MLIFVYALAAWFNTAHPAHRRRDAAAARQPQHGIARNMLALLPDFWHCNSRLWRDKLGQISLATTTLFWGAGGNLKYIVLAWAALALGYSTAQASSLTGVVAIGTAVGAIVASMRMRLDMATRVIPLGIGMGVLVIGMNFIDNVWVAVPFLILLGGLGGFLVVPMNALLQHRGHNLMGAGRSIAVQNFNEQACILVLGAFYSACTGLGLSAYRRHHRLRHRGGGLHVADQALAPEQHREVPGRSRAPAGDRPQRQPAWLAGPGDRSCLRLHWSSTPSSGAFPGCRFAR